MSRMRFAVASALAMQLAVAVAAAPGSAASVGFYGSAGTGSADGDVGGVWEGGGSGWENDTRHAGAGLALEMPTGIFRLGYRLGLGWERVESEGENGGPDRTLEGLVFDQDLAYDLYASPATRFWMGPELRIGFFDGSVDGAAGGDRDYLAVGIGPVLGFDVALNPGVALSWKLGYLFTWYSADEGPWGGDFPPHDPGEPPGDDTIDEGHAFMSLSVLFRLWGGPAPGPPPSVYQPQGRW